MTSNSLSLADWFCSLFGVILLTAAIMVRLSKQFYTYDLVLRKFNILDLQFPANSNEIQKLIRGIYQLPGEQPRKVVKALRRQLYVDFLFMTAVYGCIFILCRQLAIRLPPAGNIFFQTLAWLQVLALCSDIYENIYMLLKIQPNINVPDNYTYTLYKLAVASKWISALLGTVCAIAVVFYFWLTGSYNERFLQYALILAVEIVLTVIAQKIKII